jgi:dimeric dUTPase (all-alpha-NTP-PPase superfamily)
MENNLKVLNRIDILELVNRQKMLDKKFDEKNKNNSKLKPKDRVTTLIALNTELGEVMQDTKSEWNSWKINCKLDKEHTLEEISDYLHFLLQHIYSDDELFKEIESRNDELNATLEKHIENLLKNRKEEQNIKNSLLFLALPIAYELVGFKFEIEEVFQLFSAITVILDEIGSDWKEFLKFHHKKFELNYYKRTKEDY